MGAPTRPAHALRSPLARAATAGIGAVIDTIALSHPALAGHFPGHPIVPGVVIIDRVVAALQAFIALPVHATAFPQIKFIAPLAPAQPFQIDFQRKGEGLATFTVSTEGGTVVTGTVAYAYVG